MLNRKEQSGDSRVFLLPCHMVHEGRCCRYWHAARVARPPLVPHAQTNGQQEQDGAHCHQHHGHRGRLGFVLALVVLVASVSVAVGHRGGRVVLFGGGAASALAVHGDDGPHDHDDAQSDEAYAQRTQGVVGT